MTNVLKKGHPVKSYNVMEAASLFGVHERTVRYWIRKGWIKVQKDYYKAMEVIMLRTAGNPNNP